MFNLSVASTIPPAATQAIQLKKLKGNLQGVSAIRWRKLVTKTVSGLCNCYKVTHAISTNKHSSIKPYSSPIDKRSAFNVG